MSGKHASPKVANLASRADSTVSLDRSTEQESIVVDEGYCNLTDPSFGSATDRLACLELEDFEPAPSPSGSSRSLGSNSQRDRSTRSLASNSSRSLRNKLGSSSKGSSSSSSALSKPSPLSGRQHSKPVPPIQESLSLRGSGSLPPGSPFGKLEYQSIIFPVVTAEEADAKLKAMGLDAALLSGLQSLSPDELAVYMQLTEELKREGVGMPPSSTHANHGSSEDASIKSEPVSTRSSLEDEEKLEHAVRKLKALLPKTAIAQLQSHASYGLMDVIQSQPLTPPPTPTSVATEKAAAEG